MRYILTIALSFLMMGLKSQTLFNAQILKEVNTSAHVDVNIQVSFDVAGGLGSSNFAMLVNEAHLGAPTIISTALNGNYGVPTISNNGSGQYTFNVSLNSLNMGIPITTNLQTIATLRYPILPGAPNTVNVDYVNDPDQLVVYNHNGPAPTLLSFGVVQFINNILLPIKVKSFSAIKDGERASRLDWVTSSEVNSDYFGVERSADGNTWEQIGQVAAAGNSNTDLAYQYIDRKLPSFRAGENIFYYRLRLTDLDGQYKYTDVRGVNFGKTSNSIVSIYPNPTTEIINVDISGMSLDAGDVTLSVFDMNGRNMVTKNILGNGIELIDVDQYPAGTYNVVVQQGETIQQKKIIKID